MKTELQKLKNELAELTAKVDAKLEAMEAETAWPVEGGHIYRLDGYGNIEKFNWVPNLYQQEQIARGRIFPTREAAEKADRFDVAVQAIKDYARREMPFVADWVNNDQSKYSLQYCHDSNTWGEDAWYETRVDFLLPYLASESDCNRLIAECAAELAVVLEGRE